MSCLVEPLVAPLVGRGAGARRTSLARSRLAASALVMSAVMAVATPVTAGDLLERDAATREAEKAYRNAHKRPEPVPYRDVGWVFGHERARHEPERDRIRIDRPGLAPRFEWDAVWASRLKHALDWTRDPGPTLSRARRTERLVRSKRDPFLRFGSGPYRSGPSSPLPA